MAATARSGCTTTVQWLCGSPKWARSSVRGTTHPCASLHTCESYWRRHKTRSTALTTPSKSHCGYAQTTWSTPVELFPATNSHGEENEPFYSVNGRLYAAASDGPTYGNAHDSGIRGALLMRQILGPEQFGPSFWVADQIPSNQTVKLPLWTTMGPQIGDDVRTLISRFVNESVRMPARPAAGQGRSLFNERSMYSLPADDASLVLLLRGGRVRAGSSCALSSGTREPRRRHPLTRHAGCTHPPPRRRARRICGRRRVNLTDQQGQDRLPTPTSSAADPAPGPTSTKNRVLPGSVVAPTMSARASDSAIGPSRSRPISPTRLHGPAPATFPPAVALVSLGIKVAPAVPLAPVTPSHLSQRLMASTTIRIGRSSLGLQSRSGHRLGTRRGGSTQTSCGAKGAGQSRMSSSFHTRFRKRTLC
eukprot:m.346104 g.346104  ORF g.346104 m.346104 type:complete len:420 (-) comp27901_c3_seq10:245-1504(-)